MVGGFVRARMVGDQQSASVAVHPCTRLGRQLEALLADLWDAGPNLHTGQPLAPSPLAPPSLLSARMCSLSGC